MSGTREAPTPGGSRPGAPEPAPPARAPRPGGPAPMARAGAPATPTAPVSPTRPLAPADRGAVVSSQPGAAAPQFARERRARVRLVLVDPWSVMKVGFLLAIAAGVVFVVAISVVWAVLDAADVFGALSRTFNDITGSTTELRIEDLVAYPRVLGISLLVSVLNVVLITALATLGAFLYNLVAGFTGGFEVTLAEDA